MIKKVLQIYLLWRIVRESRLRAKKEWKRTYFQESGVILQLSDAERVFLKDRYGRWLFPAMDLGFFRANIKKG